MIEEITVKQFFNLFKRCVECHWSIAATEEQAAAWFKARNLTGTFYKVQFGWWMPV